MYVHDTKLNDIKMKNKNGLLIKTQLPIHSSLLIFHRQVNIMNKRQQKQYIKHKIVQGIGLPTNICKISITDVFQKLEDRPDMPAHSHNS